MDAFLRPSEIDERLSLPEGRAESLAKLGKIPAVRLPDGTIRIPASEFNTWLAGQRTKPRAKAVTA